jgi:hypothetical protein
VQLCLSVPARGGTTAAALNDHGPDASRSITRRLEESQCSVSDCQLGIWTRQHPRILPALLIQNVGLDVGEATTEVARTLRFQALAAEDADGAAYDMTYSVVAVIRFASGGARGSLSYGEAGHYRAAVLVDGQWFQFDDERQQEVSELRALQPYNKDGSISVVLYRRQVASGPDREGVEPTAPEVGSMAVDQPE